MSVGKKRCDTSPRACCLTQQVVGIILILVGILLLCLFVPFEIWLAVIGVALILGGIILKFI